MWLRMLFVCVWLYIEFAMICVRGCDSLSSAYYQCVYCLCGCLLCLLLVGFPIPRFRFIVSRCGVLCLLCFRCPLGVGAHARFSFSGVTLLECGFCLLVFLCGVWCACFMCFVLCSLSLAFSLSLRVCIPSVGRVVFVCFLCLRNLFHMLLLSIRCGCWCLARLMW